MLAVLLLFGLAVWVAAAVLIDAWQYRNRRATLTERSKPFSRTRIADEAQDWLSER